MSIPLSTNAADRAAVSPFGRAVTLDRLALVAGLAYLVLLPGNIPLRPPVFLHDLLGPIFVVVLALRFQPWRYLHAPDAFLCLFLLLAGLTTVVHCRGWADLFEWAIFAYMGILYWFFSSIRLPARGRFWIGMGTLLVGLGFVVVQRLTGMRTLYQVYEGSTLGFMANRFFFTFPHPNLAASFYVLPTALCLTALRERGMRFVRPRQWFWFAVGAGVLLLPLGLTVSRHMLLGGALLLGFVVSVAGSRHRWFMAAALACLGGIFLLFYLTILFPFFPLQHTFPYFNHSTFGMYTIHQAVYLKIIFRGLTEFLVGVGKSGVKILYPKLADWDTAYAILSQYKQEFLTASFVAYMDAHNEYLNLAADFGVPAMLCGAAFWTGAARSCRRLPGGPLVFFFVIAVLLACLWDDLLSKRWIWVTLGLLTASASRGAAPGPAPAPGAAPPPAAVDPETNQG